MTYDAAIVGGGPAGLNAALLLARSRRRIVLLDDGQPRNAAARQTHGFLGHDGASPSRIRESGLQEIKGYGVEVHQETVVTAEDISRNSLFRTQFQLVTGQGRSILARKLLLATGVRDVLPRVEGLAECYGVSVHHCPYCDGWEHRDEALLSLADSPKEAMGLALALRIWSNNVTALGNGSDFSTEEKERMIRNAIAFRIEPPQRLLHREGRLHAVEFSTGDPLEADALFFNTQQRQQSDLVRSFAWITEDEQTSTTSRQRTETRGLFVAGDADGDVQFLVVAAAEGATAAVAINRELQEEDEK